MTTRADVAASLETLFAPYQIPVVADPLSPVKPPALILSPGAPYRTKGTACWEHTLDVVLVVGRMDDVDVFDQLDNLADTFCRLVNAKSCGAVNNGATNEPGSRTIGDADHLAVVFSLTAYELGPGLSEVP